MDSGFDCQVVVVLLLGSGRERRRRTVARLSMMPWGDLELTMVRGWIKQWRDRGGALLFLLVLVVWYSSHK